MKVLHVIPAVSRRYGGPTTVIRALTAHLAQLPGMDVEIAATNADGARGVVRPSDVAWEVPVRLFPRTFSERWKFSPALSRWLREHVVDYDLVHVHALWSHASTVAAAVARRRNIPYIVRPAGMLSTYSLQHRAWSKRFYWWWAERQTVEQARALHATTTRERDDLRELCPNARVFVIPNGVEDAAWNVPVAAAGVSSNFPQDDRPVILCLSRLHPVKGLVDLLLPAVAKMRTDARVVLAGDVDAHAPEYADAVRSAVIHFGLERRVQLVGEVPADDRWAAFDQADVFVLPSHSENFGIVVAEAMARSRPVLITETVQICDHVREAGAGVVVPRSIPELAAALDGLLADADRRRQMGAAGREYCRKHFSWTAIAEDVRAMYETVLKGPMSVGETRHAQG